MKSELRTGLESELVYTVPESKTVPHLFSESAELSEFPNVFATAFMIGLMEWACTKALDPYLEPGEGSLGIKVNVTHEAATPPGFTVTVRTKLISIDGRRLTWSVAAHDGVDQIGSGTHERAVVDLQRFEDGVQRKRHNQVT